MQHRCDCGVKSWTLLPLLSGCSYAAQWCAITNARVAMAAAALAEGFSQAIENQGGRKAAAQTKRDIEQRAAAKAASDKAKRTTLWLKVARRWRPSLQLLSSKQDSGSRTNGEGQA